MIKIPWHAMFRANGAARNNKGPMAIDMIDLLYFCI